VVVVTTVVVAGTVTYTGIKDVETVVNVFNEVRVTTPDVD